MKKKLLSLEKLSFLYDINAKLVLRNIDLTIYQDDLLFIIGPNGGGKTSLIKILLGLLHPCSGKVIYSEILKKNFYQIGYVPQIKDYNFKFPVTVIDLVLMGSLSLKSFFFSYSNASKKKALEILSFLDIDQYLNTYISELSGGQIQKIFLARALMVSPILLILDEPTAFLDPKGILGLKKILNELNKKITIVVVSHDIGITLKFAKQVACLNQTLYYHSDIKKLSYNDIKHIYNCSVEIFNYQ